ncbi:bifunctional heptose 7-phosphate kinase/heptose 1-phosphate adenyltransferase [Helicobacter enhydrae]|uniref:Bifunctional protein HldE n=1 Tax=Helicobacter enhydrae TaxID=222136 RepID=A0A1B1U4H9_9HELI|nr:D-glycero-beta-D-manno-heptose-7-phosphate kinase [Helicobacter enhydrae]ANV97658.1 bifunctional heptose 7-phosphate kinase/heptose 1-phosphate adenyltransferase [Helicobacter enhydrae]
MKTPKILVIGDLMIDHYIVGNCSRISPEAPVQVIEVSKEENRLGGACNVANNLIALGAEVALCGVIGQDHKGQELLEMMSALNIQTSMILADAKRPTTQKSRVLVSHQQILRVDRESREALDESILESLFANIVKEIDSFDGMILSDYGKGVLTAQMCERIIRLANEHRKIVLCDPKGNDYSKYRNATLLTPNKNEIYEATGIAIKTEKDIVQALEFLKNQCQIRFPLVTLSEDGIAILEDEMRVFPTCAREVYDVTGAGDSVIAGLCYVLSQGGSINQACEFANIVAGIVVGKVGSAVATQEEIGSFGRGKILQTRIEDKIIESPKELPKNCKIVFTNGCFDILHRGHTQYLQQAKKLGDVLVVGLNTDDSVRAIKGADRPINAQEDRAYLLASLECVDYVILFDDLTPRDLIGQIMPSVLVKGADYEGKEVVGSEFAQEVHLIEFCEGRSTTRLIEKIKEQR